MAKRSSFGSVMRKKLCDITNSHHPKIQIQTLEEEKEKPLDICLTSSDAYVNQLIQEKMALVKLVEDRNGNQLRNLRVNLQKLQQQNWFLAQSNTQIIGELNLGREQLKALQHELVCKDALLKAKTVVKESKEVNEANAEQLHKAKSDDKPCNRNKTRAARCKSVGSCTGRRQGVEKEKTENKRRCLRRQSASARFKSQEKEFTDNFFEIRATKLTANELLGTTLMHEDGPSPLIANEESHASSQRSSSIGRPLRRAADKVKSYREIPVNMKMRRQE
ncbi:hypothetical protein ACFE04_006726 [Oxalis oulophora]